MSRPWPLVSADGHWTHAAWLTTVSVLGARPMTAANHHVQASASPLKGESALAQRPSAPATCLPR